MKGKTKSLKLCIGDLGRKYASYLSWSPISISIHTSMIIGIMGNENEIIYICFSDSQCKLSLNQNFFGKKIKTARKSRDLIYG